MFDPGSLFEFFGAVVVTLAAGGQVVNNLGEIAQGGRRVADFAAGILDRFRKKVPPEKQQAVLREAFQAAASVPQAEFDRTVTKIVDQVMEGQPPEEKKAATEYLKLFPSRIRATFSRPEDRAGTTVPPNFAVNRPEDLMILLPPRPPMFQEGDRPPGAPRWILVERLGIGGFGEVWKARHDRMQNSFNAFKFCLDPVSQRNILENEMENVELVRNELDEHPNIVKLADVNFDCETPWLQYEYVPGGDLGQLASTWPDDIAIRAAMAVQTVSVLAETLAHCHDLKPRCLIHRDMKPANVLVSKNGTLKITDFGISDTQARQALDEARLASVTGMTVSTPTIVRWANTPMYASDQQKDGEKPHPSDDVHALGVMIYQLILGDVSRPLNRDYIFVLESRHVCRELIDLLSRSIASDRSARFRHAGELAVALKALPKKLIVEPDPRAETERLYASFDRFVIEARDLNGQARRLFDERKWNQARDIMDTVFHPVLRDQELDKAIRLYAEGKRLKNTLGMEFVWVPPGDSWLGGGGGTPGDRKFTVEEGFWAGVYPVTQAEWKAVVGDDPSKFEGKPRFPVERVSWNRIANEFLIALNKKCQEDGYQYRLPTADEWEYICRGGPIPKDQSSFHYYFTRSETDPTLAPTNELTQRMACFGQDRTGRPIEVGSFLPNSLGVYDMHGLVWEWTSSSDGSSRVVRGGSWGYQAGFCTAEYRNAISPDINFFPPGIVHGDIGFRLLGVPLAR